MFLINYDLLSLLLFFLRQVDILQIVTLVKKKDKNRKLLRWSLTLQEYEIEYEHKAGKKNVDADALSRIE
jgi:hypothetical protein